MEPELTKPTLILKVGGKVIKEYTRGRVVQRLRQGKLAPDTLIHNPDGYWRKISDTPGFRTICAQLAGGNEKPGPPSPPLQTPVISGESKSRPPLPQESWSGESEESIGFREDLVGADKLSREEFVIESEDDDSSDESNSRENPWEAAELELDDSGESPQPVAAEEAATEDLDSSDQVAETSKGPSDRSESVNPYAGRQYFRVKPKGAKTELAYADDEPEAENVWKKRLIFGALALWGVLTVYWFASSSNDTDSEPRENLEGQAPLVNARNEKEIPERGGFGGVTPADKKAYEDLRESYLKSKGK